MSQELLAELNAFRANEGKDAFKDWRKARHMPMLEAYRNIDKNTMYPDSVRDNFEASADELAAQVGRESADIARDEKLVEEMFTKPLPSKAKPEDVKVILDKPKKGGDKKAKAPTSNAPSYKEMTRHEKSQVEKPFNLIHSFLDENPNLTRKEAVAALVEKGVNFYTARTQYQRWFKKNKRGE